jgi:hypothetical protein
MVDTTPQIDKIIELIDKGKYFTINRARQYGKTTTLALLENRLSDKYAVINISFEGIDAATFKNQALFSAALMKRIKQSLKTNESTKDLLPLLNYMVPQNIDELSDSISEFCVNAGKAAILMVDEVDKSSDNQIFLDFLGMLRNKYSLSLQGKDKTFQSVILAGVHDVKNIRNKIRQSEGTGQPEEKHFNSPWNIAADFKVDMSFNPAEIATMLVDYENDHHTGMDIDGIAGKLYRYTGGYPFLVSKLCKIIDEELGGTWTEDGVQKAVKVLLGDDNTLFDDLFKNIENNKKLYDLIFDIVINGTARSFAVGHPEIELGCMYGIFTNKTGLVAVSNEIFELLITNYLSEKLRDTKAMIDTVLREDVIGNGQFNMEICLVKFSRHYYEWYDNKDISFLEKQGRLLFITYLKPLINGQGFCHIETRTRNTLRMDLVVDYREQQFIVELKLWRGDKDHTDAYR